MKVNLYKHEEWDFALLINSEKEIKDSLKGFNKVRELELTENSPDILGFGTVSDILIILKDEGQMVGEYIESEPIWS
jgi:hypothetical protein